MLRKLLFRLATWRDPRFQVLDVDEAEAEEIGVSHTIEGRIKTQKALAALRYAREMKS